MAVLFLFASDFVFVLESFFFFFNDTATTEIYTLSLHDALPISVTWGPPAGAADPRSTTNSRPRSEEHTSELQSRRDLVCRLLLEKKKKNIQTQFSSKKKKKKKKTNKQKKNQ